MYRQHGQAAVHIPTLVAIAIIVWAAVTVIHEAGGHGTACALAGGVPQAVSTTEFRCEQVGGWQARVVTAAGSLANVLAACCCLALLHSAAISLPTWRYFLWLFISTNLFHAGSYMLIGPFTGYGDWAYAIQGFAPDLLWKVGTSAAGYAICRIGMRIAAQPRWQPLLGQEPEERRARMRLLTRVPLATALVTNVLAGLLSPLQRQWVLPTTLLAPLVLLWLVNLPIWPRSEDPAPALPLSRSPGWMTAGALCLILFVAVLGPGIGSFAGHPLERR